MTPEEKNRKPSGSSGVLARLRQAGLSPVKGRDQHFLHDPRLLRAIVADAGVGAADAVFEVGTGPGTLTRELARQAAHVFTVEIDLDLLEFAKRELAAFENVEYLRADVLEGRRLQPEVRAALERIQPFVWVANLPYSVAATLTVAMLEAGLECSRAVLLVQAEVAERLSATPGTRAYGPISVLVAFWADCQRGRGVAPGAFWPPPKVRSSCVLLRPREPLASLDHYAAYVSWVRCLFGERRKQLGGLLRARLGEAGAAAALQALNVPPTVRADSLAPAIFCRLAKEFPLDGN